MLKTLKIIKNYTFFRNAQNLRAGMEKGHFSPKTPKNSEKDLFFGVFEKNPSGRPGFSGFFVKNTCFFLAKKSEI